MKGTSIGGGKLHLKGRLNILRDIPDMDLAVQLENTDLPAINNYTEAYGSFNFAKGQCDFYSRLAVRNDQVSGYIKFLAHNISVDTAKVSNPAQAAWASLVAVAIKIFTNPSHDQFATRIDLQGNLHNIDTNIWSALASVIQNAFVEALHKGLDETGHSDISKDNK